MRRYPSPPIRLATNPQKSSDSPSKCGKTANRNRACKNSPVFRNNPMGLLMASREFSPPGTTWIIAIRHSEKAYRQSDPGVLVLCNQLESDKE